MELLNFIADNVYVLVPVLLIIGSVLKGTPNIPSWSIPYILGVVGIAFGIGLLGFTVDAVIQGILCAGAAVYSNQLYKQAKKQD